MAQNLLRDIATNPDIHENRFHMLWNSILTFHFPVSFEYGVAPQTSITGTETKPEFLVVKVAREFESIVLVVELKKPSEDTDAGHENVKRELVDYIEERFGETQFTTIYAIAGIGLSWSAFRMANYGPPEPELVYGWMSNVTAVKSFELMNELALMIDQMTGTTRDFQSRRVVLCINAIEFFYSGYVGS
ncbi:hypothetical protein K435DRAFT_792037 [Dendrothele bispora CBS 962.96]|uniref:Fungal-type protein kinase domain-containing protein n=1 Tax=Dendrothele bispora (strain CBS 962.96) TaxID=1314807 RepID=A0A4S8MK53_DENBC|nr:hypothetical protein K435DRAFT_792037 [Dendrothele bispora CBS 962.96]